MTKFKLFILLFYTLSLIFICSHANGELVFRRLAYLKNFKGSMDLYCQNNSNFVKLFISQSHLGYVLLYDWNDKSMKYELSEKLPMKYDNVRANFGKNGLLFQKEYKTYKEYYPKNYTLCNKELRLDVNLYDEQLSIYVIILTENTYNENAILKVYNDKGLNSNIIFKDTLIEKSCDIDISNLMIIDINNDGFFEIVIGIIDLGTESAKIFIYGLEKNPWKSQEILK